MVDSEKEERENTSDACPWNLQCSRQEILHTEKVARELVDSS